MKENGGNKGREGLVQGVGWVSKSNIKRRKYWLLSLIIWLLRDKNTQ